MALDSIFLILCLFQTTKAFDSSDAYHMIKKVEIQMTRRIAELEKQFHSQQALIGHQLHQIASINTRIDNLQSDNLAIHSLLADQNKTKVQELVKQLQDNCRECSEDYNSDGIHGNHDTEMVPYSMNNTVVDDHHSAKRK